MMKSFVRVGTLKIIDADGKEIPTESLRGKIVALYFSASWCIPCKKFTPQLIKFRDANLNNDRDFLGVSLSYAF